MPANDPTMGIWGLAAPLAQDYSHLGFFVLEFFAELATVFSALVCLSLFYSHTPSPFTGNRYDGACFFCTFFHIPFLPTVNLLLQIPS